MTGTLTATRPAARRAGRAPRLTLVLRADRPGAMPLRFGLADVEEVRIGRGDDRRIVRDEGQAGPRATLTLADARISEDHVRLVRLGVRWALEDRGSKNGTFVNGTKEERLLLGDGDLVELGESFLVFRDGSDGDGSAGDLDLGATRPAALGLATIVPALAAAIERLVAAARSDVPIGLSGETGTGKEVLAHAVHALSGRPGKLVAVNCGALPATLVESELFGYRKGAFSGANEDRPGLVRAAHQGTLLLDEVADLAPPAQAALLRVLQEREVTPLGATAPIPVDVRLVTATNQDVDALVAQGRFRADLRARIAGFAFALPPLRERREDLGLLCATLLARHAGDAEALPALSVEAAREILRHDWPDNVRGLERALTAALALAKGARRLELAHLPESVRAPRPVVGAPGEEEALEPADAARRDELVELVRRHEGNLSAVARALGKDRKQVRRWLQRFGIDPDRYRL